MLSNPIIQGSEGLGNPIFQGYEGLGNPIIQGSEELGNFMTRFDHLSSFSSLPMRARDQEIQRYSVILIIGFIETLTNETHV